MCGIGGRSSRTLLEAGSARQIASGIGRHLSKRGPDGVGIHHDQEVVLVHRRLAIIDLSDAGAQPLWNEDGTVCVLVNGEIYNFGSLRRRLEQRGHRFKSRSDSEVLVHLYEEEGMDGCARVEGMFAYALWDARSRDLYLVRDRLGIKPLIVSEHSQGVTFASTLPALLGDASVPDAICGNALLSLLKWGFVPSPMSAIAAARRVAPGTWVRIREGRLVEERRWWTDTLVQSRVADSELREVISEAVRSHLVADVPVGSLLSSGIDSGIVTALASRLGDIAAWTVSQSGHAEDEFPEALRAAKHFGISLREIPLGETGLLESAFGAVIAGMDEPMSVSSLVGLHALYHAIAPYRRVVLTGDGGDELFGGYDWHRGMPTLPWWAENVLFRRSATALSHVAWNTGRAGVVRAVAQQVRRHPATIYLDKLRVASDDEIALMGLEPPEDGAITSAAISAWDRFEGAGTLEQMLAVDRATALVDEMLAKNDAASMAYSVEARVPLLADAVVEASKSVPRERKRDGSVGKLCLREWFAEIGPQSADAQPKKGFNSPVASWLARSDFLYDRIATGVRLLSGKVPTENPRLMFACAVVGAWSEHVKGYERRVA